MERSTSADLLATIESQKDQLHKYETRLRDVVRAYKGLVKEKEALESSLQVLSKSSNKSHESGEAAEQTQTTDESLGEKSGEDQGKLQTLSASMATLMQEKSRLEASFIADKKKLITENEDLQKAFDKEKHDREREKEDILSQLSQARSKLRSQQLEHEAEQTNHGIMLKELQLLLTEERAYKEALEMKLEQTGRGEDGGRGGSKGEEYETRIQLLTEELAKVKSQLQLQQKSVTPDPPAPTNAPQLLDLQKDMEDMKRSYQQQLSAEVARANDAEQRLDVCAKQAEERICGLEAKISEISSIIGNYDQMLLKDKDVIRKLKERVSQLDSENAVLATSVSTFSNVDVNMDAQAIAEKVVQLKEMLISANDKSQHPVDISSLLEMGGEKSDECHPQCARNKEELEQTKEEFERYKLRVQSVLKNKNKEASWNKEVEGLREQVRGLKERLREFQQERTDTSLAHQTKVEQVTRTLNVAAEAHKQEVTKLKAQAATHLKDMELELKRQRERTISMLSEKDSEINSLKTSTGQDIEVEYLSEMRESSSQVASSPFETRDESAIGDLFDPGRGEGGETLLLHFAQERARREVEVGGLRKQKRELESALRELQHSSTLKQENLSDEIEQLNEKVWKQQRNVTRETANLEYLKNVIFNFLTSSDKGGRKQMLKAIMTILQFSPKEKDKVNLSTTV